MKIGSIKFFEQRRAIGGEENPLLIRWVVFRAPAFGIFVHKLCRSDHERALHDHPWTFVSVILRRGYLEVVDGRVLRHKRFSVLFRSAEFRHRVVIENEPAWSLVFVGRRRRKWGFWIGSNWCWWRNYDPNLGICSEEILFEGGND